MKVHLIKKQSIEDYVAAIPDSRSSLTNWLSALKAADWDRTSDIQKTFGTADLLGNGSNRVVFNIGGNNYRMICKYVFAEKRVRLYVCWIGTHSRYDQLCKQARQYTVNVY